MPTIESLSRIVGEKDVTDSPRKLASFAKDTSFSRASVPGYVVQPESAAEVQAILKLANKSKTPVTPCSSGIHFYGNTLPVQSGIIMDMRKMKKILNIDERNRMVRFEPGVTWAELQTELAKHDLMAISPFFPHPLKSALTSHLEREPGNIPKFEYTDLLVTMEMVLPDGEIFRTGSACVPGFPDKSLAEGVNPSGPGDFMWNRIFQGAQGSFGVATWVQCKIEYRPKLDKTFFVPFKDLSAAVQFVYKAQRRIIGHECMILNDQNLASILAKNWPEDYINLKKNLAPWTVVIVLAGGKRFPEDKLAYEEEALREVAGELFIPALPTTVSGMPGIERQLPAMLRTAWPEDRTYWKFACKGASQDLFFLTTMNEAPAFYQMLSEITAKAGFSNQDTGYYIQPMVYGGACHFECNFFYDAAQEDEAAAVNKLYLSAAEAVINKGGFFSRPYGPVAGMVYDRSASYTATLKKLKKMLDPNNIMAPGRLCF